MRSLAKMPALEVALRPSGRVWSGPARAPRRGFRSPPAGSTRGRPRSCAATPIRWRCGSPATICDVHRRLTPPAPAARAVFDAVEQARVEAIGSRRMLGVAGNLDAMLDDRFQRARYADIAARAEAPLEDALAMIVRERLTGRKPPKNGQRIVDLWRPWVGGTRRRRSR